MYEYYLGEGYHKKVRKLIRADKAICPDSMIDADYNMGAMRVVVAPCIEQMQLKGIEFTDESYELFKEMCLCALGSILCIPLYSKTKVPPFNKPKYQVIDWQKQQSNCNRKYRDILKVLMKMG